ncbi:MAG: hypothetical protein A2Z52_02235 [Candidatus Moranbacteria bacterium RBG_19FT_COMBO_42_6]|nr:MAG: hypothetical protein A2Z52_02235 [Candidatus Moranbacteria bacterium RBG_19FT_COMBO_42_6]
MKICVISVNKNDYAPKRFREEGKKRGHSMYITTWSDLVCRLDKNGLFLGSGNKKIEDFDAIIPRSPNFTKKRKGKKITGRFGTLLRLITEHSKKRGVFVLNSKFFGSYQSLNKLAQQFFLLNHGLPGLDSYFFASKEIQGSKRVLQFPFVAKNTNGSLGLGVYKINSKKELHACLKKSSKNQNSLLFQKYYKIAHDYRVLIVGDKSLGVMMRSASGKEWRTNVYLGGKTERAPKIEEEALVNLAKKTAHKMNLNYAGIDILKDNSSFRVIEINSLAQFKGFEKLFPGINVAKEVIKLAESEVRKLRK